MDNLPGDPSNSNSNNPPPPFGPNFNPHTNSPNPNNPYQQPFPQSPQNPSPIPNQPPISPNPPNYPNVPNTPELPDNSDSVKHEHYSEAAQHKVRDEHGRFIHTQTAPYPQTSQPIPNQTYPNPYIPSDLPKEESNFKKCIKFIIKIKWAKVTFYIVSMIGVINLIINLPPVKNSINQLFPNSSPVFAREISIQGILRTTETGIYTLVLPDQQAYTLKFKPSASLTNLKKLNEVVVKGNLTWTPYVIENAEVYPLNISTP